MSILYRHRLVCHRSTFNSLCSYEFLLLSTLCWIF